MSYFVSAFLVLFGNIKRNSKLIASAMVLLLAILAGLKDYVGDRANYLIAYSSENPGYEFGFSQLMLIASNIGIPFKLFMFLCYSLAFILLYKAISVFTSNTAIVVCIYFFFPFWMNADQTRYFVGICIALFGFSKYVASGKRRYFIATCLIASLFHASCALFLLYLLAESKSRRRIRMITAAITLFVALGGDIFIYILESRGIFWEIVLHFRGNYQKANYPVYIIFYLIIIVSVIYMSRKYKLAERCRITNISRNNLMSDIYIENISILSIPFLAFLSYSPHFERLMFFYLLLAYAMTANMIKGNMNTRVRVSELQAFLLLVGVAGLRFLAYVFGAGMDVYIKPIMDTI